jgi:acyl-[acyl-carrier-protein] desaturase
VTPLTDARLLHELEPSVAQGLERHLATTKDWLPHEWLPWSRGRDFHGDTGLPWTTDQSQLSPAARAALTLNLLTEDNLPSYHHELLLRVGEEGAWGDWVRRWTAEEARHAASLRDYVLLARALDPAALERDRMATMQAGWTARGKGLLRALVYATLQELATRIAHRNTGRETHDPAAEGLLARIAADENLHMVFYRDVVAAALAIAPEQTMVAISEEVAAFEMPGSGTPGYLRHSMLMADAGIYDARLHVDKVVAPLLRHWKLLGVPALSAQLDRLQDIARRFEQRRAWRGGSPAAASVDVRQR